jgi:hypothetical protein
VDWDLCTMSDVSALSNAGQEGFRPTSLHGQQGVCGAVRAGHIRKTATGTLQCFPTFAVGAPFGFLSVSQFVLLLDVSVFPWKVGKTLRFDLESGWLASPCQRWGTLSICSRDLLAVSFKHGLPSQGHNQKALFLLGYMIPSMTVPRCSNCCECF